MKVRNVLLTAACLLGTLAMSTAQAETISAFTGSLTASDPTQLGRLSRNGVPQDWSGGEAYPGVINTGVSYYYHTYVISAASLALTPFVQISIFDELNLKNTFVSAYAGSYNPNNKAANWLGDAGTSGNYFDIDPISFQVILAANTDLVLLVNSTTSGGGLNQPLDILVEGFIDTEFDDPAPTPAVPEPSSLLLLGSGMVGVVGAVRRRLKAA